MAVVPPPTDGGTQLVITAFMWLIALLVAIAGLMTLIAGIWLKVRPPRFR